MPVNHKDLSKEAILNLVKSLKLCFYYLLKRKKKFGSTKAELKDLILSTR